jgi:hypothetical protein
MEDTEMFTIDDVMSDPDTNDMLADAIGSNDDLADICQSCHDEADAIFRDKFPGEYGDREALEETLFQAASDAALYAFGQVPQIFADALRRVLSGGSADPNAEEE